jgi:uncharacterized protein YggL (DUF469 family)
VFVIVFEVRFRMAPRLSMRARNAVIEAFITEAIEGNDLQFGGGGGGQWWEGIAEPHSTLAATEAQRQAVEAWLAHHPRVVEFEVGPLESDKVASEETVFPGGP